MKQIYKSYLKRRAVDALIVLVTYTTIGEIVKSCYTTKDKPSIVCNIGEQNPHKYIINKQKSNNPHHYIPNSK